MKTVEALFVLVLAGLYLSPLVLTVWHVVEGALQ